MPTTDHAPSGHAVAIRGHARFGQDTVQAWGLGTLGVVAAVAVWELLARTLSDGGGQIARLAGPGAVAGEVATYVTSELWSDVWPSLQVFAGGWLVGGVSAAVIGVILGRSEIAGRMFIPVVEAIRPVSSIAWVPLAVVWFGLGYTSKVFVVGLAVFLVVIVYAIDGSRRIPTDLQRTAIMLGMGRFDQFRYLVLPGTLTEVLIGLRVALMAGWGTVIIAELVAADSGLGAHLIASQRSYDIEAVMAAMATFAATGFLLNGIFAVAQRRLTPWRQG